MQIREPLHGQDPSMNLPRLDPDRFGDFERLGVEFNIGCGVAEIEGDELDTCELAIQKSAAP